MAAQVSTTHPSPVGVLSMAAKRQSYQDGFAHALLGMAYCGAHARSDKHYGDGYAAGQEWLLRNGFTN